MKSRTLVFACLALALALPLVHVASADHGCNGVVTRIDAPGATIYIDHRNDPVGLDIWIYRESNGKAGLQTGGVAPTGLYSDDCAHINPDTIIY